MIRLAIIVSHPIQYYALVDGGVVAANPGMCAYAEAIKLGHPDVLMVSLGTGELREGAGSTQAFCLPWPRSTSRSPGSLVPAPRLTGSVEGIIGDPPASRIPRAH